MDKVLKVWSASGMCCIHVEIHVSWYIYIVEGVAEDDDGDNEEGTVKKPRLMDHKKTAMSRVCNEWVWL